MVNISNLIKYYLLISIFINNFIQAQNYKEYKIKAEKKSSTLDNLNIIYFDEKCEKIIPSLFDPIFIFHQNYVGGQRIGENPILLQIPFFIFQFTGNKYYLKDSYFLNYFQGYFIKYYSDNICYFGLSMSYPNDTKELNENEVLLSYLKENKQINKKIFSFDKFILNEDTINTNFYFGDTHNDFSSNEGIIGTCKINEEDIFWGCSFNEMIINNKSIPLTKTKDNKLYKIYLTTEDHSITFPKELKSENDMKEIIFDNKCNDYDRANKYFTCNNVFNGNDYIPLKLISEDINITLELDNFKRYYLDKDNDDEIIRINFSNENYIIFPLILFKQFHVQFDAEKKVINFYTTNSSLLQAKQEKKETPKNEEEGSSGLTTFLVILIILLIIGIGLGVFYFIRKRKNKVEKDINRFTKFEDEEDFKNMNENKVY